MLFPVATSDLNPYEQIGKATRRAFRDPHTILCINSLVQGFAVRLTSNTFQNSFLHRFGHNSICPMLGGFAD
jgi:hypothetical protein